MWRRRLEADEPIYGAGRCSFGGGEHQERIDGRNRKSEEDNAHGRGDRLARHHQPSCADNHDGGSSKNGPGSDPFGQRQHTFVWTKTADHVLDKSTEEKLANDPQVAC